MNEVVSNNQSINQSIRPADLLNPKRPHDGGGCQTKPVGLTIPDTPTWRRILKDLRLLAARDDASCSYIYREALIEYHQRHFPGNPTPPLDHWIKGEPFSEAAREKITKPKMETCEKCDGTGVDKRDGLTCTHCGGHKVVYLE
jgi:hypothetical protein